METRFLEAAFELHIKEELHDATITSTKKAFYYGAMYALNFLSQGMPYEALIMELSKFVQENYPTE